MREIGQAVDFRDSTEIVFLSPGGFRGNSKYLFLIASLDEVLRQRCLWLTESAEETSLLQNAGLHAQLWATSWGHNDTWSALRRTKLVVASDLFMNHAAFPFIHQHNQKVRLLQLWHGWATKSTGEDFLKEPSDLEHFEKFSNELNLKGDFISASSDAAEIDAKNWPNWDVHHLREPKMQAFIEMKGLMANHSLLGTDLGAVGFSRKGPPPVLLAPSYAENADVNLLALVTALDKELKHSEARAILKLHHHQSVGVNVPLQGAFSQRLYIADSNSDVYPLIQVCSGLITDYSSLGQEANVNGWPFALWDLFGEAARSDRKLSPEMIELREHKLCRSLGEALLAIGAIRSMPTPLDQPDVSRDWIAFISARL